MKKRKIKWYSLALSMALMLAAAFSSLGGSMALPLPPAGSQGVNFDGTRFVQVTGGLNHSLALTEDGRIYSWGTGYATGHGGNSVNSTPKELTRFNYTRFNSSGLLTGGDAVEEPLQEVNGKQEVFIKIAASQNASAALTNFGRLFVWGAKDYNANASAPLQNPDANRGIAIDISVPTALVITGLTFTDVAAGDNHMIALGRKSGNTVLVGWGRNNFYQTGRFFHLVDSDTGFSYQANSYWGFEVAEAGHSDIGRSGIDFPAAAGIAEPAAVFAGGDSSALVLTNGKVITWGRAGYSTDMTDDASIADEDLTQRILGYSPSQSVTETVAKSNINADLYGLAVTFQNGQLLENITLTGDRFYNHDSHDDVYSSQITTPKQLAVGYYRQSFSVGSYGTLYATGTIGSVGSFGFNYDGAVWDGNSDTALTPADRSFGANATISHVAAARIPAIQNPNTPVSADYIAAALGNDGTLYVWGKGVNKVGSNSPIPFMTPYTQPFGGKVKFAALFSGYDCIYLLDNEGKIYVMGDNSGNKLLPNTVAGGGSGALYPVEVNAISMLTGDDLADSLNTSHTVYNKLSGGYLMGNANPSPNDPTTKPTVKTITLDAAQLFDNPDIFDALAFLPAAGGSYPTLYGGNVMVPALAVTTGGSDTPSNHISVSIADGKLVVEFLKKSTNTFTIQFSVGKSARTGRDGDTPGIFDLDLLQSVHTFSINVRSLNSAPAPTERVGDFDFVLDPNGAPGNPALSGGLSVDTLYLTDFFDDKDGDVLILDEAYGDHGFWGVDITNADRQYIAVTTINANGMVRVEALAVPPGGSVVFSLYVKDGIDDPTDPWAARSAMYEVRVKVEASPTTELRGIAGVTPIDLPQVGGGTAWPLPDTIFHVVDLVVGHTFTLRMQDMFLDYSGFSFGSNIQRLDQFLNTFPDITVTQQHYQNGIISIPSAGTITPDTRSLTFIARQVGYVDYVISVHTLTDTKHYVFRFAVEANKAPEIRSSLLSGGSTPYLPVEKDLTLTAKELFWPGANEDRDKEKDDVIIESVTWNPVFADVKWSSGNLTILPRQNGSFTMFFVVSDLSYEGERMNTAHLSMRIEVRNYYKTAPVIVKGGRAAQTRPLEWFITYINNSLLNENAGSGTITQYDMNSSEFVVPNAAEHYPDLQDALRVTVQGIGANRVVSFQSLNNRNAAGYVLVGVRSAPNAAPILVTVPVEIEGIHRLTHDATPEMVLDVAAQKQSAKTSQFEFSPDRLAQLIGKDLEGIGVVTIDSVLLTTTEYAYVSRDGLTGNLVIKPRAVGEQQFELGLTVGNEYCFVIVRIRVENITNLPSAQQYAVLLHRAIWIAVGLIGALFLIRLIRWWRKRRFYKNEMKKYKMLTKIQRNMDEERDKEEQVRNKLRGLDPEFAKIMDKDKKKKGDKKKKKTAEPAAADTADPGNAGADPKTPPPAPKAAEPSAVAAEKPAEERKPFTEEVSFRKSGDSPPQEPIRDHYQQIIDEGYVSEADDSHRSERDILEEKIKAKLAEEQAAAEAQAAAEQTEEEEFQNMTKAERKKAEMLKKLRAKYQK